MNVSGVNLDVGELASGIGSLFGSIRSMFTGESIKDPQVMAQVGVQLKELEGKFKEYDTKVKEAQSQIIVAEAQGESWLQRNWRPLTMMIFLSLLVLYWFDVTPDGLEQATIERLFDLLEIGIGGYIAGRSVEKTAKYVAEAFKDKK